MDYLSFGAHLISQHPQSRTLRGEAEGRVLWVKQAVPPKARIWHGLQKLVAAGLGHPILRATVSDGGGNALRMEVTRLREFRDKGFHAPEVVDFNDAMIVITDLGPQLRAALDSEPDGAVRMKLMQRAAGDLARLHRAGLAHGRPYLRDMTWDGERIGFLDLEENPVDVMPLAAAQARDVWIFLSSAGRFARDGADKYRYDPAVIFALFETYRDAAGDAALAELARFVRLMRPLRWVFEREWLWRRVGNDVRQSVFATQCLEVCMAGVFEG